MIFTPYLDQQSTLSRFLCRVWKEGQDVCIFQIFNLSYTYIEKIIFPCELQYYLHYNLVSKYVWVYFWAVCSVHLLVYLFVCCDILNNSVPSKFICRNLIPNVVILEREAFGMWLNHVGGALMNGIRALTKVAPGNFLPPSVKRQPYMNKEVGFHQIANLPVSWSWTS